MKLYNSLSREVEEITPLKKGKIGMYTCGPTVYDYAQIGNGRKYVYDDVLRRALVAQGYEVTHVQNITDVGHLVSDADDGEDKLEKGARRTGKTVWEVAKYYENYFFDTMDRLNNLRPTIVCRATEHIEEMVALVKRLVEKGFAYETAEAVYFDVGKFPRYASLFGRQQLEDKLVAVREEVHTGELKKHPADFAVWFKRVGRFADHQMHWPSPWGEGFPGWHIECSAMGMKYLGETFDIHTGGEDHLMVHHPNEIAQSEAATGKPFVKYWVHYAFLTIDGQKMSKSLNNFFRLEDLLEKGFHPMALRYLYLTAHYRTPLNFTWSSLAAAQTGWDRLNEFIRQTRKQNADSVRKELSREKLAKLQEYKDRFNEAINADLNTAKAIAVMWEMLKSNIPDYDKVDALVEWDQVLGLELGTVSEEPVPNEILERAKKRDQLRQLGKFVEADDIRMELERQGWMVEDTKAGPRVVKKSAKKDV